MTVPYYRIDADRLREARHMALLTQEALARESTISLSTIKRLEEKSHAWKFGLRSTTIKLLASALQVNPKFLITEIHHFSWQGYPTEDAGGQVEAQTGFIEVVDSGAEENPPARIELKVLDLGVGSGVQPLDTENSRSNTLARRKVGRVEPGGFAEWYETYPLHLGRVDAAKAYEGARRLASVAELLEGAQRFRDDPNLPEDRSKIPYPATWLRAGRWTDEPLPERPNGYVSPTDRLARRAMEAIRDRA